MTKTFDPQVAHQLKHFPLKHYFFERGNGQSMPPYSSFNTAYRTSDPMAYLNRATLLRHLGLESDSTRYLNPCHGDKIVILRSADWKEATGDVLIGTDAAITTTPGTFFVLSTADCIPLMITDVAQSFAAIVHLGWRNVVAQFTTQVIRYIKGELRVLPNDMVVGIGPSIYSCCYKFANPVQLNDPFWRPYLNKITDSNDYAIDLISPTRRELESCGVKAALVEEAGICTSCNIKHFFSCFREGYVSGRFPTVLGLVSRDGSSSSH